MFTMKLLKGKLKMIDLQFYPDLQCCIFRDLNDFCKTHEQKFVSFIVSRR